MLLVVMGVTGSGKSTVGEVVAERLGVPYADADIFHSEANIAKMAAGEALTDEDRLPWLRAIGAWLSEHRDTGAVATCSALRRVYRDTLRERAPETFFLHLHGDRETARSRVSGRRGHFMPSSLVDSQFDTLEPLEDDERGIVLDLARPVDELVEETIRATSARR